VLSVMIVGDHGVTSFRGVYRGADEVDELAVREDVALAGGAAHGHAVRAALDEPVDLARQAAGVGGSRAGAS
jgi:hypothetical protein